MEELTKDGAPTEWIAGDIDDVQLDKLHDEYSDDLDEINLGGVFDKMARARIRFCRCCLVHCLAPSASLSVVVCAHFGNESCLLA